MRYGAESIDLAVIYDGPRRRYALVKAVPTVADVTRAAYVAAIKKYVRFMLLKDGLTDSASLDPAALSPDVNGWYAIP